MAVEQGGRRGEVRFYGQIASRPDAVANLVKTLAARHTRLAFAYEAGPTGYGLFRQLSALGYFCLVVAPSLTPTRPGEQIKTDRRDALSLAGLFRAGELTPIWVPDPEHEAMRDLVRARIPKERSSGSTRTQGAITKAGNSRARRMLVESAWTYRLPPRVVGELLERSRELPEAVRAIGWKAQVRLCNRYWRMLRAGRPKNVITVAIARELAAFIWAIAVQVAPVTTPRLPRSVRSGMCRPKAAHGRSHQSAATMSVLRSTARCPTTSPHFMTQVRPRALGDLRSVFALLRAC